jgi:CRP-like cAMP-binding protein
MRKSLEILGHLSETDIDWLMAEGGQRHLPAGSVVIEAGVPLKSLLIVLDGQVQVLMPTNRRVLATLYSGEILGEISVVDPRPPQVEVRAKTSTHVLDVPRCAIDKRLAEDQPFAARFYFALACYMAERLRNTTTRLGYGQADDNVPEYGQFNEKEMDEIALAGARFNTILQRMRTGICSVENI